MNVDSIQEDQKDLSSKIGQLTQQQDSNTNDIAEIYSIWPDKEIQETKIKAKRGAPKKLGNVNEGPLDSFIGTNINQSDEKYSNKVILKRLDCVENEVKKLKVDNTGFMKVIIN